MGAQIMSSTEGMEPIFRSNEVGMSELHKLFQSDGCVQKAWSNKWREERSALAELVRTRSSRREAVALTAYDTKAFP
jgi:hypothetical protein